MDDGSCLIELHQLLFCLARESIPWKLVYFKSDDCVAAAFGFSASTIGMLSFNNWRLEPPCSFHGYAAISGCNDLVSAMISACNIIAVAISAPLVMYHIYCGVFKPTSSGYDIVMALVIHLLVAFNVPLLTIRYGCCWIALATTVAGIAIMIMASWISGLTSLIQESSDDTESVQKFFPNVHLEPIDINRHGKPSNLSEREHGGNRVQMEAGPGAKASGRSRDKR